MSDQPLVSVIIPLHNTEKYIEQTINSVLSQTWPNIELIIVDDGSTDNSYEAVKKFEGEKVKILRQTNQGASAAKQNGLNIAQGQYIQYLDADDLLDPDKIGRQVLALLKEPNKVAVCKTVHFFGDDIDNGIEEEDNFFQAYLDEPLNFLIKLYGGFDLIGGMIQPNAFLTPKTIIDKAGPWNSSISPCTDEDGEYFTRVILNSAGIIFDPGIFNYYRKTKSKNSLSGQLNPVTRLNLINSIWTKHLYMLSFAQSTEQETLIHNATYRSFDELKVQIYLVYNDLVRQIENYQRQLHPSLKIRHHTMGGAFLNTISKTLGWKAAKRAQIIKQKLLKF
ncbi:glycosyltransferase family 2 protein [Mucilaginibacter sp. X4EP1]|uniref:glycosyltransferase family 2 protein n=1 Tax=Mucilaginibacter sp. X4EP1 TaxID=2723092 RepID=UPI00216A90B3|nr:glycosyltransferase family 2 protein [Mucilaginibacter sp. X4EP1]MCS3811710.1 glycosyltransferase involved in cell wall biosynthesis [Mucilaginibacter sp. X4EP1]